MKNSSVGKSEEKKNVYQATEQKKIPLKRILGQ
jgi:hypothetical protein